MSEPTAQSTCPICEKSVNTKRMKKLYDMPVCPKCRNGFANRRQFAYLVDAITFWLLWFLLASALYYIVPGMAALNEKLSQDNVAAFICNMLIGWVIYPIIFCMKDGFHGQSPGKWLCGVRAVDKDTLEPIGFGRSLKRNLPLVIPFAPLIVAFLLLKGRRWGDTWANTRVILKKHAYRPPFDIRGIMCTHCGYNLTGNVSGRCPECGHDIPVVAGRVPMVMAVA
jgi:uncharacterized RDD family membrane protein YckC